MYSIHIIYFYYLFKYGSVIAIQILIVKGHRNSSVTRNLEKEYVKVL